MKKFMLNIINLVLFITLSFVNVALFIISIVLLFDIGNIYKYPILDIIIIKIIGGLFMFLSYILFININKVFKSI